MYYVYDYFYSLKSEEILRGLGILVAEMFVLTDRVIIPPKGVTLMRYTCGVCGNDLLDLNLECEFHPESGTFGIIYDSCTRWRYVCTTPTTSS